MTGNQQSVPLESSHCVVLICACLCLLIGGNACQVLGLTPVVCEVYRYLGQWLQWECCSAGSVERGGGAAAGSGIALPDDNGTDFAYGRTGAINHHANTTQQPRRHSQSHSAPLPTLLAATFSTTRSHNVGGSTFSLGLSSAEWSGSAAMLTFDSRQGTGGSDSSGKARKRRGGHHQQRISQHS
jgi:hypothetical protein